MSNLRDYFQDMAAAWRHGGTAIANLPADAQRRLKNRAASYRAVGGSSTTRFRKRTQKREIARHLAFKAKHGHFA